jgi:prepilin-type N-terminal cleavage/methylation domain-containing protein/prepilin-type processing-associated H-X9-DG protein
MGGANVSGNRVTGSRPAFTLVELLVVVAIIAVLMAMFLATASAVRRQADAVVCASNLRQLASALILYRNDQGRFPPNQNSPTGRYWYEAERLEKYIPSDIKDGRDVRSRVLRCPADDLDSFRSFAMNTWASSSVDAAIVNNGRLWGARVPNASQMILLADTFSYLGSAFDGYCAPPIIAWQRRTPARWFGAPQHVASPSFSRLGPIISPLAYSRHRDGTKGYVGTAPAGRVNIAYLDGHVELKRYEELVNVRTNKSTLDSWWTTIDDQLDR